MVSPAPSVAAAAWPARVLRWAVRWRYALGALAVLMAFALGSIPNAHPPRFRGLDKLEHVAEYFCVGLLFLNVATRGFTRLRPAALFAAWLAVGALSFLDESWQRNIPGRSFDRWDIAASSLGGLIALLAVLLTMLLGRTRSAQRAAARADS
jgi:VanZ family protein